MKAPSEKHLEDWIVENLPSFKGAGDYGYPFAETIVARQLRLPSGIADLVVINLDQVVVIELKRDLIDEAVVGQTLRYISDLKRIWHHAWTFGMDRDGVRDYQYCFTQSMSLVHGAACEIGGLIVGHKLKKPTVINSAAGAGIQVVRYEFDGDTYSFGELHPHIDSDLVQTWRDFAYGSIGEAMREVMKRRSEFERGRLDLP